MGSSDEQQLPGRIKNMGPHRFCGAQERKGV